MFTNIKFYTSFIWYYYSPLRREEGASSKSKETLQRKGSYGKPGGFSSAFWWARFAKGLDILIVKLNRDILVAEKFPLAENNNNNNNKGIK